MSGNREPRFNERQAILVLIEHLRHSVAHTADSWERTAMVGEFYEALNSLGVDMEVVGDVHAMPNLDSLLNG